MTLRDLLEKGEGQAYVVNKNQPTTVTEIDCVMKTQHDFKEAFPIYRNYFFYGNDNGYILARKSRAKNATHYNGTPRFIYICSGTQFLHPTIRDLDKTKYDCYNCIIFLSKEDACNYVIEKLKKRKMELNGIITKINKFKFNVTE